MSRLIKDIKTEKIVTLSSSTFEIKAPTGYELSNEIVSIEINDNGVFADGNLIEENNSMYSIDFENDIIEVPNTGDNRHTEIFALIGVLSAILFIVITVYEYKKRKNNI